VETKAAVVREKDRLTIEAVQIDPPKEGEVLVRIQAAGVCHSDLHTLRGELRTTPPLVLGHEGAGIVEKVGPGVENVKPGDRIVINWLPSCDSCPQCLRGNYTLCEKLFETTFKGTLRDGTSRLQTRDGMKLKQYLSASTMAEYTVIDQASAVIIPDDVPFEVAAVVGCAVATGVGSVINTARTGPGSSAAVIGCGGVGLSMVMGCRLAGAHPIIAVDVKESKLAFARELGASDVVDASKIDAVERLREMTGGGPDYVFDSVGGAATIRQALEAARRGGTAVVAGLHSALGEARITPGTLVLQNKSLLGSFAGSTCPRRDLPMLLELFRAGRLPVDRLITRSYRLEQLDEAFADMEAGTIARSVITFEEA
jgi:Zn-dependent alcohol dehydrogenase